MEILLHLPDQDKPKPPPHWRPTAHLKAEQDRLQTIPAAVRVAVDAELLEAIAAELDRRIQQVKYGQPGRRRAERRRVVWYAALDEPARPAARDLDHAFAVPNPQASDRQFAIHRHHDLAGMGPGVLRSELVRAEIALILQPHRWWTGRREVLREAADRQRRQGSSQPPRPPAPPPTRRPAASPQVRRLMRLDAREA